MLRKYYLINSENHEVIAMNNDVDVLTEVAKRKNAELTDEEFQEDENDDQYEEIHSDSNFVIAEVKFALLFDVIKVPQHKIDFAEKEKPNQFNFCNVWR